MTKSELKIKLTELSVELAALTTEAPADFVEFNTLRLKYDIALDRLKAYQSQLSIMNLIEDIEEQEAGVTP